MTSETRKEERISFRTTFKEVTELEEARAMVKESISQFCKLSLRARIRWVLKNHRPPGDRGP